MKKIFSIICPFIISFIFLFIPSFSVHAESFALSADSLQTLSDAFQQLQLMGIIDSDNGSGGIMPFDLGGTYLNDALSQASSGLVTAQALSISSDDVTVYDELPYDVYDAVMNDVIMDKNGNLLSFDDVKYATFDNGYFNGHCLVDNRGDIVYSHIEGISDNQPFADVALGGEDYSVQDWVNTLSNLQLEVANQMYNYNVDGGESAGISYSYYLYYATGNGGASESLYIANQYIPGLVVPTNSSVGSEIKSWYTNDLSLFDHQSVAGSLNTLSVTYGHFNKDGHSYGMRVQWIPNSGFGSIQVKPYAPNTNGCFGKVGYFYSTSYYNDNILPFKKVVRDTGSKAFDPTSTYSISDVSDFIDSLADDDVVHNTAYDPSQAISEGNYPVVLDNDSDAVSDPSIPIAKDDEIVTDPSVDYPFENEITIPSGDFSIPIIDGLKDRFPFSIPWDLKNLLKGLRAVPKAPRFQGEIHFPIINYTYHIDIDLTQFNSLAQLFKLLFLISFVIELARFSYTHFFGT